MPPLRPAPGVLCEAYVNAGQPEELKEEKVSGIDEVTELIILCFDSVAYAGLTSVDYVAIEVGKMRINHDGNAYLVTIEEEK